MSSTLNRDISHWSTFQVLSVHWLRPTSIRNPTWNHHSNPKRESIPPCPRLHLAQQQARSIQTMVSPLPYTLIHSLSRVCSLWLIFVLFQLKNCLNIQSSHWTRHSGKLIRWQMVSASDDCFNWLRNCTHVDRFGLRLIYAKLPPSQAKRTNKRNTQSTRQIAHRNNHLEPGSKGLIVN